MNRIFRKKWIFVFAWAIFLAVAIVTMPNINQLVRNKEANTFDSTYSSTIATNILNQMDKSNHVKSSNKAMSMVLIYYNKNTLSATDKQNIEAKVNNLTDRESKFGVLSISNLFSDSNLADSYISKDKTTLLVPITIDKGNRSVESIRSSIMNAMKAKGVSLYATSGDLISEDFSQETQAGVHKTEVITVIFIIAILLLIFKSPIAPLVNLMSVCISFLVSLNITFQLVKNVGFPVSNFSEMFLVLVLFGIGTDYTMLLLMRYREELNNGLDKSTAIRNTYQTAGRTVFFSSFTIFIGFVCLYFVQFKVYRSASAIAIGIVILDLVLFTFIPVVMKLFGKKLFWSPFHFKGHSDSKVWGKVAGFSAKYPYVTVVLTGLVCCLVFFYNGALSYNDLKEVASSYPSIVGDKMVTAHFSIGESMPVTIAIKNTKPLNNQSDLAALDSLTSNLKSLKGVNSVYSVTQPKAQKIDDLYISSQAQKLSSGLNSAKTGIQQICDGLQSALSQLQASTQSGDSLGQLQNGTVSLVFGLNTVSSSSKQLSDGLNSVQSGSSALSSNLGKLGSACEQLSSGMHYGASISGQITQGISKIKTNLSGMGSMLNSMVSSYGTMQAGLTDMGNSLGDAGGSMKNISGSMTDLGAKIGMLSAQLGDDPTYAGAITSMSGDMIGMQASLGNISKDLTSMQGVLQEFSGSDESTNLAQAQNGLSAMLNALGKLESASSQLSSGLFNAADGQKKIFAAITQLKDGANQLDTGLKKVSDGQVKISDAVSQLASGAVKIQDGQNQLIASVKKALSQTQQLSNGLNKAVNGLNEVSDGLSSANSYLNGLSGSQYSKSIFYIPNDQINSGDFVKSMGTYMSLDRKITKLTITLTTDPYSNEAMNIVNNIYNSVEASIKNSALKNATYGISGITQSNIQIEKMSNSDFSKSCVFMLLGIFILLLIITRKFWMPVFILGSLIGSYFISISLSGMIFRYAMNEPELSWLVPFCSFVMIVALGVDYSIFLIMRHNENSEMSDTDSIVTACRKVGGVITPAALILSGTFASMYPSGVLTLMELAITVILGLIMLSIVFLPITIPTLVSLKSKLDKLSSGQ